MTEKKTTVILAFITIALVVTFIVTLVFLERSKPELPQEQNPYFNLIGFYDEHPDTSTWGFEHEGWMWYCKEHHQYAYWNGTHTIPMRLES